MKRTGTCKDTSHPETMTEFSGLSHHALKTLMSIPILLNYFRIALNVGGGANS